MNVEAWLKQNTDHLAVADISTARLDCLVLLEDQLSKDRAWLLAHPEYELQGSDLKILNTKIAQRAKHIPLAYIRGKAEFYGREFMVNAHTLVPRPETETMIDTLQIISNLESDVLSWQEPKKPARGKRKQSLPTPTGKSSTIVHTESGFKLVWNKAPAPIPRHSERREEPIIRGGIDLSTPLRSAQDDGHHSDPADSRLRGNDSQLTLVDIGTGSGAIAITAKLEHPEATVIATDIDEKCLQTAVVNAKTLGADIIFLQGSLLKPLRTIRLSDYPTVALLCNLPYVPDTFQINTAATHEPRHALFGGPDGLDLYRELFDQIKASKWRPSYILTESLPPQHESLTGIAESAGYQLTKTNDFIQQFEPA